MTFLAVGDSKTGYAWRTYLKDYYSWVESPQRMSKGGYTVANMRAAIDGYITAAVPGNPQLVFINLGVNDFGALPDAATWKADYQYIIDALHTKYPAAMIFLSKPWSVGNDASAATVSGWIDDLIAAHPTYVLSGDDEQVWLKSSDNGASLTFDGTHYSDAGCQENARQKAGLHWY